MSDLLKKLKLKRLSGDFGNLDCCDFDEIITALRALEDLETIVNQKDVNMFRYSLSKEYAVVWGYEIRSRESTLPAALRAAVEAIQKGETE